MGCKGSNLLVRELLAQGVQDFFYLVAGPMSDWSGTGVMELSIAGGMRGIDVRDERAAAFAAVAYSRVAQRAGVVMAGSGPGTVNTVTGVSHAFADGAPVVVIGGSAPMYQRTTGAFQETDQVSLMRPITKWAHQVSDPEGIPEAVARGFQIATSGRPGPVYLDMPADVLYGESGEEADQVKVVPRRPEVRSPGDPKLISTAIDLLERAHKPIVIAGSGVLWSKAWQEFQEFVEVSGIPFYTTPMARGLVPEDHPLCLPAARSAAFREADCLLVVGTRDNFIFNYLRPPVMSPDSSLIELNIHPEDLSRNRLADVAILADAKLGLRQLTEEIELRGRKLTFGDWTSHLSDLNTAARVRSQVQARSDEVPIHPLRLCAELDRQMPRDSIRVVDGHETLGWSRRGISAHLPGRMLTPGVYGTMGVGIAFGIGAKVAAGSSPVVVLTGDGAFGYHAMEIDTAVRHSLGMVCVIANNGGWTAHRGSPGHALGFTDYQCLADMFGCWGAKVTEPSELGAVISQALDYAKRENKPALVNVIMSTAPSSFRSFTEYTRHGESHYGFV
jgi:thiamine pyrophosphate-dependent acetolactate synthase large subunit-like protein